MRSACTQHVRSLEHIELLPAQWLQRSHPFEAAILPDNLFSNVSLDPEDWYFRQADGQITGSAGLAHHRHHQWATQFIQRFDERSKITKVVTPMQDPSMITSLLGLRGRLWQRSADALG